MNPALAEPHEARYRAAMCIRTEIVFRVEADPECGGYVARWDDPAGGGITTQGDSFSEMEALILDAVQGYFTDPVA